MGILLLSLLGTMVVIAILSIGWDQADYFIRDGMLCVEYVEAQTSSISCEILP